MPLLLTVQASLLERLWYSNEKNKKCFLQGYIYISSPLLVWISLKGSRSCLFPGGSLSGDEGDFLSLLAESIFLAIFFYWDCNLSFPSPREEEAETSLAELCVSQDQFLYRRSSILEDPVLQALCEFSFSLNPENMAVKDVAARKAISVRLCLIGSLTKTEWLHIEQHSHGLLTFCTGNPRDLGDLFIPSSLSCADPVPHGEYVSTVCLLQMSRCLDRFRVEVCGGNLLVYKLNM